MTRSARHVAAALLLLSATAAAAAPAEVLEGVTVALPAGWKTPPRLVVPPVAQATVERLGPAAPLFAVGPGDAVWFGVKPGVLIHATRGYRFRPGVPLSDLAVLDGGTLLLATPDALGFLASDAAKGAPAGAPVIGTFQPAITLPVSGARLATGANGSLYVYGTARGGDRSEVFLIGPEPGEDGSLAVRSLRKVFSTAERVSAVAGDGDETFVAVGRVVARISDDSDEMAPAFVHPSEEVTGLARTRSGLLFYATASAVGVVAPEGTAEFVRAPNAAIRAVGDALYILLGRSFAVLEVGDTGAFREALRPRAPG